MKRTVFLQMVGCSSVFTFGRHTGYGRVLLATVALLISSCATIFTGSTDDITFNSDPEGAKVYIDGIEVCKTPCTAPVKRRARDQTAEFRLDGYDTRVILLSAKFNAVSIFNVLNGGAGWIIDAYTGAIMKYDRKLYSVELDKDKRTSFNDLIHDDNLIQIDIDTRAKRVNIYVAEK